MHCRVSLINMHMNKIPYLRSINITLMFYKYYCTYANTPKCINVTPTCSCLITHVHVHEQHAYEHEQQTDFFHTYLNCIWCSNYLKGTIHKIKLKNGLSVCGRAQRGPVCSFLVVWLQIIIEPFCCVQSHGFDFICFIVIFHS